MEIIATKAEPGAVAGATGSRAPARTAVCCPPARSSSHREGHSAYVTESQ